MTTYHTAPDDTIVEQPQRWRVWHASDGAWVASPKPTGGLLNMIGCAFRARSFKSHANAIAYADRMARTREER